MWFKMKTTYIIQGGKIRYVVLKTNHMAQSETTGYPLSR